MMKVALGIRNHECGAVLSSRISRGAESRCDRHHGETRVNHASRRIPWNDAVPAYVRRDAPISSAFAACHTRLGADVLSKNAYFFRRPMKKKTGIRSQSGRPKRNGNVGRRKQRKTPKKKQAAPPLPLWLQVSSRVD